MRFLGYVSLIAGLMWTTAPAEALAQESPLQPPQAAVPFDPSPIIGVPAEQPVAPAQAPAPGETVGAPAAPPAQSEPGTAPASAAASSPPAGPAQPAVSPKTPRPPVAPSHDSERPPAAPAPPDDRIGFAARLAFGLGGSLWINGEDTKLVAPLFLALDLGYALTRNITLMARGSSWLPTERQANEFLGAGLTYRFLAARLYVAAALGVSLTRHGSISEWKHYVQGLALEADVGQQFALSSSAAFSVGAHFQLGTPLVGEAPDAFSSVLAGIFVAVGLR